MSFPQSGFQMVILILVLWILNCQPTGRDSTPTPQPVKFELRLKSGDPSKQNRGLLAEHYPASNERRIDLFWKVIDSLGGVYLGVGTDQNLSFAARAKSEYVILMDFDPEIVKVNRVHIHFLKNSENYPEFKKRWERKNKSDSLEFLKTSSPDEFEDLKIGLEIGFKPGIGVPERLSELDYMNKKFGLQTFSHRAEDYSYLRKLALENRIFAIHGDLTGSNVIQELSEILRKENLTINLMYTSNAEEYFRFPEGFRKNIKSLPISERSILIRTITAGAKSYGFPEGEKFPDNFPFHYNFQKISNLKKWMDYPKDFNIPFLLGRRTDLERGFSEIQKEPPEM